MTYMSMQGIIMVYQVRDHLDAPMEPLRETGIIKKRERFEKDCYYYFQPGST